MLKESIIRHCAPTLAGIKVGNLFNCAFDNEKELKYQIKECNKEINPKGVYIKKLRQNDKRALIYVYREKQLKNILSNRGIVEFLSSCEYKKFTIRYCIDELINRIQHYEVFPHEIGIFIGYPLSDVKSFIDNKGKNSKCLGYWKAYSNESKVNLIFEKFKSCTNIYYKSFLRGMSIEQLTVVV